ncbi:ABC transporter permease [Bernardetia sp. OM2101]|uniref:ABC transporter permease n=1 Tax=Bernardetia sp. OM2101 TaxID=3344876 RepID=UPI0035CEC542
MSKIKSIFSSFLSYFLVIGLLLVWSMPILYLFTAFDGESSTAWNHIAKNLLLDYTLGSLKMLFGVSVGVLFFGVPTAWLVSTTDFFGRKFFEWALVLPLAIPAYILAYTYAATLSYTGGVGIFLRENDLPSVQIMSDFGGVFILSLALYPYVYAVSKTAFSNQLGSVWEASKMLGKSSFYTFFKVVLPLARPFIFGGLFLVLMEVLNEYGTFKYYGIQTFTTGIFSAWAKFGDVKAALRLALCLLGVIVFLVILEKKQRGRMGFSDDKNTAQMPRKKLSFYQQTLALIFCSFIFCFAFGFPVLQLIFWTVKEFQDKGISEVLNQEIYDLASHTITLAFLSAFVVVIVAILLGLFQKRINSLHVVGGDTNNGRRGSVFVSGDNGRGNDNNNGKKINYYSFIRYIKNYPFSLFFQKSISRIATMGYAVPGAVIAVGVLGVFLWIDKKLYSFLLNNFDIKIGLFVSGTVVSLIYAYSVRFLSVGFQPVESQLIKIGSSLESASKMLGKNSTQTFFKITLPLLRPAMLTALLLVFVDVSKELPLTLILRPFNYDTLATKAYELADQEFVAQSALPALLIILVSLLPAILLSQVSKKKKLPNTIKKGK